jgi:hypothetical protein
MSKGAQRGRATLEMDLQGSAPEGVLSTAEGLRLAFTGWTELASALEEWRAMAMYSSLDVRSGSGVDAGGRDRT